MAKAQQTIHKVTTKTSKTTTKTRVRSSKGNNQNRCPTCGKYMKKK